MPAREYAVREAASRLQHRLTEDLRPLFVERGMIAPVIKRHSWLDRGITPVFIYEHIPYPRLLQLVFKLTHDDLYCQFSKPTPFDYDDVHLLPMSSDITLFMIQLRRFRREMF